MTANLPGTSVANQLVAKIKTKCEVREATAILNELPNPAMEDDSGDNRFNPLEIDVFVQTLLYVGSKSFSHSFVAINKFLSMFKTLAESEEAQICILRHLYEVWHQHPQMICVLIDEMLKNQIVKCSAVANWIFSKEMSKEFTRMYLWEILHLTIKKMNKHVTRVSRDLRALTRQRREDRGESESDSDNESKNADGKEKPTAETIDRMEETLEAAQADQKNLFLIIFQVTIVVISRVDYCIDSMPPMMIIPG
ncbi:hypothetical protein RUM43_000065 [Polyplax serrata]|uniref:MIF4G-like type 2 domain-containing protein n=1 Tax=Polyplax serrata TaxID=468196 RepID=A0AAN8SC87_POLSC